MGELDFSGWGPRFKRAMRANGHNLAGLAQKFGLAESTLRHWTNGKRQINLADFFKLCEYAGVDPQSVLFGDRGSAPAPSSQALALATKIDSMRQSKAGSGALDLIEMALMQKPVDDAAVEKAYKTNERPRIRGEISRPSLFNDDFSGPRDG